MRYFVGFVLVLALVVLPLGVGAQDVEEAATAEPGVQEPASSFEPPSEQPAAEPAPEEPALQLKLDDAGVEVAPGYPPRTADGYALEKMEVRVRQAKGGCAAMVGVMALGVGLVIGGALYEPSDLSNVGVVPALFAPGFILTVAGVAGMVVVCNKLPARK